jgi:hypothetical protein
MLNWLLKRLTLFVDAFLFWLVVAFAVRLLIGVL